MENTSGMGEASVVPEEIKGWSWGAFLWTWLWGVFNGTFLALLCFIPFLGLIMRVILGVKGNEWAWRNKKWASVEEFQAVQRKWAFWGVVIIGGVFVLGILAAIVIPVIARGSR